MRKMRFLASLLICAILFQSMLSTFSLTAAAAEAGSELTFNGGYPYGKDMTTDSVTLVAPVQGGGSIQWYRSTARDGEYEPIPNAKSKEYRPDFSDKSCYPDMPTGGYDTLTLRAYENGTLDPSKCPKNWYKCTVDGQWSKPVQLLQAVQVSCFKASCPPYTSSQNSEDHTHSVSDARKKLYQIAAIDIKNTYSSFDYSGPSNTYWYISNGFAAYTVYPKSAEASNNGTYLAFDVLGRYKHRSTKQNYEYYWLGEAMDGISLDTNNYTELRLRFDDDDEYRKRVLVDVDLPTGQDKMAMIFTPRLGAWKMYYYKDSTTETYSKPYTMQFSGMINAIFKNSAYAPSAVDMGTLTGIQMVGNTGLSTGIMLDTPAWNITFEENCKPSSFWLGNKDSQMYQDSKIYDPSGVTKFDPSKYAHSFNTKPLPSTGTQKAEEKAITAPGGKAVISTRCFYVDKGLPGVYPLASVAWSGTSGRTVSFGVAAGTVIDTKAAVIKPQKCPILISGKPVIWMNTTTDDASSSNSYTYDGEPIELEKNKTVVDSQNELVFTTAELRRLLDVEADLDYTFYEAEGTRTKDPSTLYKGAELDGIPIDSRDYFLTVSVPESNPYFKGTQDFYLNIAAKQIPVYNVKPKDKYYDGTKKVEWDWDNVQWGDNSIEEYKVYERDKVENWFIERIDAEFEDAQVGDNKKIVGLNGEAINIIHWSDEIGQAEGSWRNYYPYLPVIPPTASIKRVPVGAATLAPPEAEFAAATTIKLKEFPSTGKVEYAMKVPDPDLSDPDAVKEDLAAAPDVGWQESPEFPGLVKDKEYYFYLRLTGDPNFDDGVVTSGGAAISTVNEPTEVKLKSVVTSRVYDGTPIEPQPKFKDDSSSCPAEALAYTWYEKVRDPGTNQYIMVRLDAPPKNASYNYIVEVSIKPEYASDYVIKNPDNGVRPFSFSISQKNITKLSSAIFKAVSRAYNGTDGATLSYEETALRTAIEKEMVSGDTTAGMTVAASGSFSDANAGEDKRVYISVVMTGPGAANYFIYPLRDTATASIFKAGRTIAAPEIAGNGQEGLTLAAPEVTGVDATAGTDGTLAYAASAVNTAPEANSTLWQTSPKFSGLSDGTRYYFFARITDGVNYNDAVSEGTEYLYKAPSASDHTHDWDSGWTKDSDAHWHECLAGGCPVTQNSSKDGYGDHSFSPWAEDPDTGDRTRACTVCGYRETGGAQEDHTHNWDGGWTTDNTAHWHECLADDCPVTGNSGKDGYAPHSFSSWEEDPDTGDRTRACTVCGYRETDSAPPAPPAPPTPSHTHSWDSGWTTDNAAHWHECLAGGCPVTESSGKDGYGPHRFTPWAEDPDTGVRTRTCTVCGYQDAGHMLLSQISFGTWTWSRTYHDQGGELLFSMERPTLQISAVDSGRDLVSVDYAYTTVPSDPYQFTESTWRPLITGGQQLGSFTGRVVIPEPLRSGVYVYARVRDAAGDVRCASTPRLVFDTTAPEIMSGSAPVTSGCTYCSPRTVAVSDNLGLASVTLDGMDVTASADAIWLAPGKHNIVAIDSAGNCTTAAVQVNDGHTNKVWSIPASCEGVGITVTTCVICGYTSTTPEAAAGHDWETVYTVDQEPTCTEPGIRSLHCARCGVMKDVQEIPAAGHALEAGWHMGASRHWKVCSVCGERAEEMSHQRSGIWEPGSGRPADGGVTEHMKCAICGAILAQRYRPVSSDDPNAPRYGSVEKQTDVKSGAPEAKWNNSIDYVLEAVDLDLGDLTDENQNAVSHKLVLSVSPLEGNDIPGQREIEKEAEDLLRRADAEFLYMDVSLTRYTYEEGGNGVNESITPITTTNRPMEVMLRIPEELQIPPAGMSRTFYLLYAHKWDDGTMESAMLKADSRDGSLYFLADRFSTYAIVYLDTPIGEADPPQEPVVPPETPDIPSPSPAPPSDPAPVPPPDPPVNHIDYIHGYNGQFRPDDYMSRAEAAQIFYRLLTDKPKTWLDFDDVPETAWYAEPVSALAGLGIVSGIGDHLFDPHGLITRAEFAAVAARFMGIPLSDAQSSLPDVPDDAWYSGPVAACESAGWIKGYPDGLFHPSNHITRAEAVTMINHMMGRAADEQALAERIIPFSDVPETHWAYLDILEAAIAHKAILQSDGSEIWET